MYVHVCACARARSVCLCVICEGAQSTLNMEFKLWNWNCNKSEYFSDGALLWSHLPLALLLTTRSVARKLLNRDMILMLDGVCSRSY